MRSFEVHQVVKLVEKIDQVARFQVYGSRKLKVLTELRLMG